MMKIKAILKEKGMTVQDLADSLGVTRQALSKQIQGKMLVETAQKIAAALGVPVWALFDGAPDPQQQTAVITCPHCGEKITIKAE